MPGEKNVVQPATDEKKVPPETVAKLRTLSHDLSNYIETIMQASYLLAQATQDAARVNREIREILRAQS
jgi:hypothetical protein